MKKGRKSALILSAVLIITLMTPVFSSADEVESINLRNFEETILITDLDIIKEKKEVAIKQLNLTEAQDNANTIGDTDIETRQNRGYFEKEAQMNLDYEYWKLENIQESVLLDGKENYFTYLLKKEEIKLHEAKIQRLKTELGQIETKIALGTAVQSEKVAKELEITKEEFVNVQLGYELDGLALDLTKSLLWDLDTTIEVFNMSIPTSSYEVDDLQVLIDDVLEKNGDIVKLNEQLELAEMYLDILYEEDYVEEDDEIIDQEKVIADLKLDIRDKKFSLEYDVYSKYNDLLNAKDQLEIKTLEIKNLDYNHNITQKRFDVGLEVQSTLDYQNEEIAFAQHDLESAQLAYYIQVEAFRNMVEFED